MPKQAFITIIKLDTVEADISLVNKVIHHFHNFPYRTNNTLMADWMERTKSRHFGAFRDSYPEASPFSANRTSQQELVRAQLIS